MNIHRVVSSGIAATVALAALIAAPTVAVAPDDGAALSPEEAEIIVDIIDAAAPASSPVAVGGVVGGEVVMRSEGVETVAPLSRADSVRIATDDEQGAQTATITLPAAFDASTGVLADDGTVVYGTQSGGALAVQTLRDGSTRVQTVIDSPTDVHRFEYGMEGYVPYQSESGETMFLDSEGDFVAVAAPWAVDANGADVPTFYEIRDEQLVQVVVPDESTVYPVVADPTWMWNGPAWGMKLTRSETSRVRDYSQAGSMCVAFSKGAPAVAIACGAFAGYMATQAALAESDKPKSCLFFTAAPIPGVIWRVKC